MALIPGGSYKPGGKGKEVSVPELCMDIREVTHDQYQRCLKEGKCGELYLGSCEKSGPISYEGRGDHPIVCVDLKMAKDYCAWQGKRLATDVEWEWAARGAERGTTYPWGNEPPDKQLCWSGGGTARTQTCAVASFPAGASPHGVMDLAGNVGEWVTSKHDSQVPDRGGRGGSWQDALRPSVKATHSSWFKEDYRCGFLGIRCVRELPGLR
jgi:formylglycine-generating enzyme required for sulfatase activity